MIRLILAAIQIGLCVAAAFSFSAARAADGGPPPAPYRPLAAGTVLDYGTWTCTVEAAEDFVQTCRGPEEGRASFYAKLVPFGRITAGGYGSGTAMIVCETQWSFSKLIWRDVRSIGLKGADRSALRGLWPLSVGKEAAFRRNFRPFDGSARSTIKVSGTRTASVMGAERPVFVLKGETRGIECSGRNLTPIMVGFDETWWYAPDLDAIVHYELKWVDAAGPAQDFAYDLKSLTVPSGAVVAAASPTPQAQPPRPAAIARQAPAVAQDTTPPVISTPQSLTTESVIAAFAGRVSDASRIVEVAVDGRIVPVRPDGSFAVQRGVAPGQSQIRITATDEWGNRASSEVSVTRIARAAPPPQPSRTAAVASPAQARSDPYSGLHFGSYHALVIGNNRYKAFNDLRTAEADAEAVADLLRRAYGFDVALRLNATRSDVLRELAHMRAKLTADDSLLVYYAGHGVVDSITEQGYWLPVDAEQDNPANWVSTNDITTMLRAIRAKHVMVVADSCYSGTLVRAAAVRIKTARERRVWVERVLRKRARTALVSGGLEPVMDGGGSGHSVFANAFITALAENRSVLEGEALFDAIKRPVVLNSDQTPQYSDIRRSGHEGGDFLFVRR